jgi:L-alanine-DL-glutamate epimerase-like enolase superfamily enzyme
MRLSLFPYRLQFKYPFRISHGTRTGTDVVYVKLEHDGLTAWGEATLPPYLPETQKSVTEFLTVFSTGIGNADIDAWFEKLNDVETDLSAKAALDMALWDMKARIAGKTVAKLLDINTLSYPYSTYTIGACDTQQEMQDKVNHGLNCGFEIFKLKLTNAQPEDTIKWFRTCTDKPFAVDANQAWQLPANEAAIHINDLLKPAGCLLVEQPYSKNNNTSNRELRKIASLPLYADESCQRLSDLERLRDSFDGINIKLMKCGGITEAIKMIHKARELDFKILIGCMSESSVGCSAAAQLTPLADLADLDGPWLINKDSFTGLQISNGRLLPQSLHFKGW